MIIRILLCLWPVQLLAGRWIAAWPSAEVVLGHAVVANKVAGVRACLIHETFSAHQGVEDDDLNVICLGGRVVGHTRSPGNWSRHFSLPIQWRRASSSPSGQSGEAGKQRRHES